MSKPDKRAIRRLVDAAVREKLAIANHDKRLKAIKAKLAEMGTRCVDEWEATDGGGNSWIAQGTGLIARVTYPANKLKDAIDASAKAFIPIRQVAGEKFRHLFEAASFFKPVAKFREKAVELLGKVNGGKLIKLCESDNEPKVSFEAGEIADREDKSAA